MVFLLVLEILKGQLKCFYRFLKLEKSNGFRSTTFFLEISTLWWLLTKINEIPLKHVKILFFRMKFRRFFRRRIGHYQVRHLENCMQISCSFRSEQLFGCISYLNFYSTWGESTTHLEQIISLGHGSDSQPFRIYFAFNNCVTIPLPYPIKYAINQKPMISEKIWLHYLKGH